MANQILHQLDNQEKSTDKSNSLPKTAGVKKWTNLFIGLLVVFFAVVIGRLAAQTTVRSNSDLPPVTYTQSNNPGTDSFGQKNEKLCPDIAEGTMKKGGIDGEGTHHLKRKGGDNQNVYLTSSTVDLSLVENKKVKVWGKTYAANTAGWLMDVCYLELK